MSTLANPALLRSAFQIGSLKDPAYTHYLAVAESFPIGSDEWLVAMCHDWLEDRGDMASLYKLLSNFTSSNRIDELTELIAILTRLPGQPYFEYIESIASFGGVPLHVKIADIRHHLSRKETLKPSLEARYRRALLILQSSPYHMSLEGYPYAY